MVCRRKVDSMQLVHLRYRDHILFRNADSTSFQPSIRETVGWVLKENDEAVYLVWDKSLNPQRHERSSLEQSGLVILKGEILEMKAPVRNAILNGADIVGMSNVAIELGMTTLRESGLQKVKDGVTTPEEVLRVTIEED